MVTDDWAYAAWGRSLAVGNIRLHPADTYPQPVGYLLGLLVQPFPPVRAFQVITALALAAALAGVFRAGLRSGGPLGAAVAATALALTTGWMHNLQGAVFDAVIGALVGLAAGSRGRVRVGLLVIAGLARPEAWAVAALAAFMGSRGRFWPFRVAAAIAGGLAAPIIWALSDLAAWGRPFAFLNQLHGQSPVTGSSLAGAVTSAPGAVARLGYLSPGGAASALWSATSGESGAVLVAVGAAGLLLQLALWRRRRDDLFVPFAAALWALGLFLEFQNGLQPFLRYTYPLVVLLAVGFAPAVGWRWRGGARIATAVAVAACAAVAAVAVSGWSADPPQPVTRQAQSISASLPELRAALRCGPVGVFASRRPASALAPVIAVTAGAELGSLPTFHDPSQASGYPSVLLPENVGGALPQGVRVWVPVGVLVLSPACSSRVLSQLG